MPRAGNIKQFGSKFFPTQLTLQFEGLEKAPDLSRASQLQLLRLHVSAWRLYRARKRQKVDKDIAEKMRDKILKTFNELTDTNGSPVKLYGIVTENKRVIETRVTDQHFDAVLDPAGFLAWLGDQAAEVGIGAKLPLAEMIKGPEDLNKLLKVVAELYGDEIAEQIVVTYDRDEVQRRIESGALEPAPTSVLDRVVGSQRVLVNITD